MRIAIGCDDTGFLLKEHVSAALEAHGHDLLDLGTFSPDPVDYPDYARAVGQALLRGFVDAGMFICGSGASAAIAANKIRGIRASLCHDPEAARLARAEKTPSRPNAVPTSPAVPSAQIASAAAPPASVAPAPPASAPPAPAPPAPAPPASAPPAPASPAPASPAPASPASAPPAPASPAPASPASAPPAPASPAPA